MVSHFKEPSVVNRVLTPVLALKAFRKSDNLELQSVTLEACWTRKSGQNCIAEPL